MMWSPLPVYQVHKGARRKAAKAVASSTPDSPPSSTTSSSHRGLASITDLLEPAVDGPPSPERIRALVSKQLMRDRHQSQQTTSSGSSSLVSAASDGFRPSWEHGLETLTLSRRSSQRSTSSSMPSRERPESVQIFGKTLFNRKGKLRRDSSDHSSSTSSSMYAAEAPGEAREPSLKSAMFARRKSSRAEEEPPAQKKLQISGPYNFQHLTHTPKENMAHSERPSHPLPKPRNNSYQGFPADHLHFSNFSSEALPVMQQDPSAGLYADRNVEPQSRGNLSWGQPWQNGPLPKRLVKRAQSQEQIRAPPPRPPRSPTEHDFTSPIPPPPRMSSRIYTRNDGQVDPTANVAPLNLPISPKSSVIPVVPAIPDIPQSPASFHGSDPDVAGSNCRFSHAITTPDDVAWPLPVNAVNPLPDVPEEDENRVLSRGSHLSVASNSSSLRGSVSVPLLRQIPQTHTTSQRPPSNASETLGRFDLFAAQRALRVGAEDGSVCDDFGCESWEDDIDYCYDHAAEADCDFAWERPSLDMMREEQYEGVAVMDEGSISPTTRVKFPVMLSPPSQFDLPALSPASQTSNTSPHEAITPTILATPPVTSNFSLPRRDSSTLLLRSHARNLSQASSFKESHGFSLSPSLLIPNDFHQQMLVDEKDEFREEDEDEYMSHASPALSQARSSASTTDSALSERSGFSSRHKSTTSISTAITRWTGSSTSAGIEGWQVHGETCQPVTVEETEHLNRFEKGTMSPLPEIDESSKREHGRERHTRAQSHADILSGKLSLDTASPDNLQPVQPPVKSRRRAKTTSRSHPTPVQLGLFPSLHTNHA
ncbi:uncharacterized protein BCR38DRAFT_97759 [Pseudomassariella vexata]|uniref:CRIB domain-containing protein n=1 Tax=Pseudomassariella vexata TaxID=1141098 RepID=A0A1Y2EFH4_9PEZI|nr:uncharacterized protein BCR38DRAFT_97759 [Pseudomassariella vexata]ORY70016.1 hypothetical protein BCR38DRAFT_97759 [Pseudomassariella vexata]